MPAGLPGDSLFDNQGNPNEGNFVIFDGLSGPKDATFDAKSIDYTTGTPAGWHATEHIPIKTNDDSNVSTGALSTGIGFGAAAGMPAGVKFSDPDGTLLGFADKNFTDDYIPGATETDGSAAADSTYMYIGGGKSEIVNGDHSGPLAAGSNGYPPGWYTSQPDPYTAGFAICGAGNGGSRDSGANTGFPVKLVTATGAVANGAAVEAGYNNRSGVALVTGQSVFGSAVAASAAPALAETPQDDDEGEEDEEEVEERDDDGIIQRVKRKVAGKKAKQKK